MFGKNTKKKNIFIQTMFKTKKKYNLLFNQQIYIARKHL